MRRPLLTVYRKELRDALRDRRTALMIFIASVVTGPLMLVLMAQFVSNQQEKATNLKVLIAGEERAPELVNFFQRHDVEIETAPKDYEARIRQGLTDAVIVVPADFEEKLASADSAHVDLVFDDSRTDAGPAIQQAERLLRAFNQETGTLRMIARGVSPGLVQPVKVERVNTATPRQRGALILFIFPVFAILAPILGGLTIAIDSTAGERERGSLEPLLANPVPAREFAIGKWLAAWTLACSVAVLTLSGFAAASVLYAQKKILALQAIGAPELGQFILILVPFAAMTSALTMMICTFGRSYREAQTYMSYLVSVISFVPVTVMLTGLKDAQWQLAVPMLAQQAVLGRVMRGDALGPIDYLVPAAVAVVVAGICLAGVARQLTNERIVFGRA
ncbi:MAG: ABC transporter permease [Usitatibacter sp.]